MKHSIKATTLLIIIFVFSQIIGLYALNVDIDLIKDKTGKTIGINYSDTAIGERPDMNSNQAFWYLIFAILFGTGILLILIYFKQVKIWKTWFFLAVWLTITVTLGVFINVALAYLIAFIVALIKVFRPNFIVHNLAEIFMYSGIAILFVPLLNVYWMVILLIIISFYDAYSVWQSKHMIKMANFQTQSRVFAGITVPYKGLGSKKSEIKTIIPKASNYKAKKSKKQRIAILGGGDIAFPLLFSGTVMQSLIINNGLNKTLALLEVQLITITVTFALTFLLIYGKKDKFYPAMPFLTAGCLIGYMFVYLVQFI